MARRTRKPAPGAVPAELPFRIAPELAKLPEHPPRRGEWICEVKFDGYRFLCRAEGERVQLITRNGHDWTAKLPVIAAELLEHDSAPAWLDGEIVALDKNGLSDFDLLQVAFADRETDALVFYVFDMPFAGGWDLRAVPLMERRRLLMDRLGADSNHVRLSQVLEGDRKELLERACAAGLEGLIAKRADSRYVTGRSDDWIKLKCPLCATFFVGGVVLSAKSGRTPTMAALLLGIYDARKFRYVGKVGTGFSDPTGRAMLALLLSERREHSPFEIYETERKWGRAADGGETIWLNPVYRIAVTFYDVTDRGHVRHATIRGSKLIPPPSKRRRTY